jgi:BMFP domain-containing protein YqiC
MQALNATIKVLRRELRASMGDRNKLSKLHSQVTEDINQAYGEEKEALQKFRQEVRDALNCRVDNWEKR